MGKNFDSQILFGILGLSITIATFLPALVYTYNKQLLMTLLEPSMERSVKKWQRIVGFIFTTDLLLTQSMIQVIFSACYGIFIFIDMGLDFSDSFKSIIVCFPIFIITSLHWYFAYDWSLNKFESFIKNLKLNPERHFFSKVSFWKDRDVIKIVWKSSSLVNLIITSTFVIFIFFYTIIEPLPFRSYCMIYFLCFESMVLILLSISWIFPLVKYQPLIAEVDEYIDLFNNAKRDNIFPDKISKNKK